MPTRKNIAGNEWTDPDDAPELTREFFERADIYHGDRLIRRGRPKSDAPKQLLTVRLDREVIDGFRETGPGWQTRINDALKEWLAGRDGAIKGTTGPKMHGLGEATKTVMAYVNERFTEAKGVAVVSVVNEIADKLLSVPERQRAAVFRSVRDKAPATSHSFVVIIEPDTGPSLRWEVPGHPAKRTTERHRAK